jgi:predicted lipid-binding transport protein (Tim44 family)
MTMTKALTAAAMILLFAPSVALAQHRAGDAALGAVSGAVVLGPIGAVAGAFIGYSAGPSIARSWGLDRSRASRNRKQASKDAVRASRAEMNGNGSTPATPTQTSARVATSGNAASNPPPAAPAPSAKTAPPVQTLE